MDTVLVYYEYYQTLLQGPEVSHLGHLLNVALLPCLYY
jgi:hypothetical protein